MKRIKGIMATFAILLCVLLSGCGRRFLIPSDWVYLTYEEALEYYKEVDFTLENVAQGFVTYEKNIKRYNEWEELQGEIFNTIWGPGGSNIILFNSKENNFLMDCSYTVCNQTVKLNPQTLEVIEIIEESSYETRETMSEYPWSGIVVCSYYIPYNLDGSVVLNDEDELIVQKRIIQNFKIERVKGHAEWMLDIPEEYMMNTSEYTAGEGMSEGQAYNFFVVEGKDAYFIYECFEDRFEGVFCRPQTTAYKLDGTGMWSTGGSKNFMDGYEEPFND